MNKPLSPGDLTMRPAEFEDMWRRLWLSLIFVLSVMIGIGLIFTAVLNSYGEVHCRHVTNDAALARRSGLL
jgi:hypothetical protein